jgi:hypothetical protein
MLLSFKFVVLVSMEGLVVFGAMVGDLGQMAKVF